MLLVWVPVKGWQGHVHHELRYRGETVLSARGTLLADKPFQEPRVEGFVFWTATASKVEFVHRPLNLTTLREFVITTFLDGIDPDEV